MPNKASRGRPSRCYRKISTPYTRKKYIKRVPDRPEGLKKMSFGNTAKLDFKGKVLLISRKDIQVTAKALESIRVHLHRALGVLGEGNYRLQIKTVPFQIVRTHGITMAKAERMQKGMRHSFGNPFMLLSQVHKGKEIVEISIPDEVIPYQLTVKSLKEVMKKLPPANWIINVSGIGQNILNSPPVQLPKVKSEVKREKKGTGEIVEPVKY